MEDMAGRQQTQVAPSSLRPDDSSTYWQRRRRNNEAARRCRERRRMEELLLELHAMELLRENQRLRAALCALYPGPPTSDWTRTASTCTVHPGDTHLPYWTGYPGTPPPETTTLRCHFIPPASPDPVPGVMVPPSHAAPCTSTLVTLKPQTADTSTLTLSSLPHKLRLKRAWALGWPKEGTA